MTRWRHVAVASLVTLAACGGGGGKVATRKATTTTRRTTTTVTTAAPGTTPTTATATAPSPTAAATTRGTSRSTTSPPAASPDKVGATKMATLASPIALAVRPGEASNVYVAQQNGVVKRLRVGASSASVDAGNVLDISDRITSGGEQGLLGMAFAADGATLYVDYTDTNGDTNVVAYPYADGRANAAAGKRVLFVDQPYPNHNGGEIVFGPDGFLYVGLGDGGSGGDPQNHAQDLGSLLGKILRIAPNPNGGYTVPGDNPFVHTQGATPEIWHWGLRNPWRFSFDRANGEQWIGDVGQNAYEEIDHVGAGVRGVNFGWNKREALHPYNGGAPPAGAVNPEIEVAHGNGSCAIVGGYVYRGSVIRGLAGTYLFTDNCRGQLVAAVGGATRDLGVAIAQPSSLGEDANGELWVLSLSGSVFRLGRAS